MSSERIHETQPVYTAGVSLEEASAAAILLHGRGATAQDILPITEQLPNEQVAYLAPQAANRTWYPHSGFGPLTANEPFLSSAMETITKLIDRIKNAGIPLEKIVIGGFSQGACLAAEYVAQHPQRYGGLFILSGALMGPLDRERDTSGSLDGLPVSISGVEHDSWVKPQQFLATRDTLAAMGADVTVDVVPGDQHSIRPAELEQIKAVIFAKLV